MRVLACFQVTRELEHLVPKELRALADGTGSLEHFKKTIDTYDEGALEAGLRLRDAAGAEGDTVELTALTVGECDSRFVRNLFAVGYYAIVQIPIDDDLRFDPESVANAIASYAVSEGGFDVILTGQQSSLGSNGLTHEIIAVRLGIPCVSDVFDLELSGSNLRVASQSDTIFRSMLVREPAVYAFGNARHPYLRMATLRESLSVADKEITQYRVQRISPRMGLATLEGLEFVGLEKKCKFVEGASLEEQVSALWSELRTRMATE